MEKKFFFATVEAMFSDEKKKVIMHSLLQKTKKVIAGFMSVR